MKYSPFVVIFSFALFPFIANAHVTVTPKMTDSGGYAKLVFQVPHGCDGSPTTKITIQIPDGVLSVKPQVHPGWEISMKSKKLERPAKLHGKDVTEAVNEVSWSGGLLPDEYMDEFGMSVKMPEQPGAMLYFSVIQDCKKGSTRWDQKPAAGKALDSPAPVVMLGSPADMGSMHHH